MIIEEIELFHVSMPMKTPWRTAFGEETSIDSILVRMTSGSEEGWGEAAPYRLPHFSPEWASGAFGLLRDALAPALIGKSLETGWDLQRELTAFKGNQFAKAGLDTAWWDLAARLAGEPLWKVIGGTGPHARVGADIAVMDSLDDLVAAVGQAQESGFQRTKLKFRRDWGFEMVARVREAFPEAVLHVDCNSAFSLDDADMFQALDRFGLAMIEQPLAHDDLIDHARLQALIRTPICLDESITSVDRARKAIDIGACGWINIKPGRVGGLTNAIAIHDLCAARDVPCWIGGMLESAIGQGAALALSTLPNVRYPSDVFPTERLYNEDLAEPGIELCGPGRIDASSNPGHGFKPNPGRLSRMVCAHALVS